MLIDPVVACERGAVLPADLSELHGRTMTELRQAGLLGYVDHLRANPAREQAMLELSEFVLRTPDRSRTARRRYEQYPHLAETSLQIAAEASASRWWVPVRTVARMRLALTEGLTLSWLVDRDDDAAREAARAGGPAVPGLAEACAGEAPR